MNGDILRAGSSENETTSPIRPGLSSAFKVNQWLDCPSISKEEVKNLGIIKGGRITRHIKSKYLEKALQGEFWFGTLISYRAQDERLIGRFSDVREASQLNYYKSRTGLYNFASPGLILDRVQVAGFDAGVTIEFFCNDYCSCSSISDFDEKRALTIRERGNPDLGAYVVYDFNKLIAALKSILRRLHPSLSIIYQNVIYGDKDRHWEIEEHYNNELSRDQLAVWLSASYVKSLDYAHEEELRIMIINRKRPGGLPMEKEPIKFKTKKIASSIVGHGFF